MKLPFSKSKSPDQDAFESIEQFARFRQALASSVASVESQQSQDTDLAKNLGTLATSQETGAFQRVQVIDGHSDAVILPFNKRSIG